ncbi:ribonuclease H [Caldicellulosiruptor hydrothermalis 108]|uniref:Ribonuclease H n=1 Tax=Caldicellulosiruptor hydrothermalis (strain DSM 18901 / VKM B-2411 / 108) TaxID=632292 RepID=E4QBZ0_CALH1|nr:reverse transcriptase-like protein [Caldicellulosiruptor hydrothermalis]ADQ06164.1 ribonuclease H [Caldicellulosiruptor hydrothermalis 108]
MYKGYFDGASKGNPGPAGAGIVIVNPAGNVILEYSKELGIKTNNEAEYLALIELLQKALELGIKELEILGDSQLVINQVFGSWNINMPHLYALYEQATELLEKFDKVKAKWIPREKNQLADSLSNKAITRPTPNIFPVEKLEQITDHIFIAHGTEDYAVDLLHRACTCPDFVMRHRECKHLLAAYRVVDRPKKQIETTG